MLNIARTIEKQAERLRMVSAELSAQMIDEGSVERTATFHTVNYCGALASLISSTLCEIVENEQAKEIFSLGKTNCVLREWGLDELV